MPLDDVTEITIGSPKMGKLFSVGSQAIRGWSKRGVMAGPINVQRGGQKTNGYTASHIEQAVRGHSFDKSNVDKVLGRIKSDDSIPEPFKDDAAGRLEAYKSELP